ncbi:MAG: hypothetical protein QE271_04880 [Bacteriovoracaceae bacterium]|nr:hypothetical protein [Bacteriovoracaceae bacterium]
MKPIKLSASKKNYTAHSGIYVLKEVMEKLKVKDIFRRDLPSVVGLIRGLSLSAWLLVFLWEGIA